MSDASASNPATHEGVNFSDGAREPALGPDAHPDGHDLAHLLRRLPHEPGWFERHAVGFLRARASEPERAAATVDPPDHPPYVLTAAEREAVHAIVRRTVIRSFLTGATSAGLCVGTWLAAPSLGATSLWERWAWLGVASVVATAFEIWRMYFDHLGAVAELLILTGARIAATRDDEFEEEVAHALARASLDLPDPRHVFAEIDPERETSHLALLALLVLYKGKRSISNFLGKELLLHLGPTGTLRALAPWASVPITGLWNALVSWRVLREARLRALGPSAIHEVLDEILPGEGEAPLSEACRVSLLRAVGTAMVRKHTAHPNLVVLLWYLVPRLGEVRALGLDDTNAFLGGLAALEPGPRALVLEVLQLAAVLDGYVGAKLRALVSVARRQSGLSPETHALDELERRFLAGERVERSHIEALAR